VYDGTTAATIVTTGATSVADLTVVTGSRQSVWYQNRLWIFGNAANPSNVYYSDVLDPTTKYSIQFLPCSPGDGEKITSLRPYFIPGQLSPVLMVGKSGQQVGIIRGDGSTINPYTYIAVNNDAGIPGFRQIVQFGSDVAYLTRNGVASYQSDNQFVNLPFRFLTDKVRNSFLNLNQSQIQDALCWYDKNKTRITFAVPEPTNITPNLLWHYDVRVNSWYKERWGIGQDCTAAFTDSDGTLYHGDSNGKIYQHSDTLNAFDANAISAFYKTGFMDFGLPGVYKRILEARITLRSTAASSLGVGVAYDYGQSIGPGNTVLVNGGASSWGAAGINWSLTPPPVWGAAPLQNKKFYPSGYFKTIQFAFNQSGLNQPIDMYSFEIDVEFTSQT